jgi:hypothetical protein
MTDTMTESIQEFRGDLTAHLRALEETLHSPSVRRDPVCVDALLAPDFVEFGSSGRVWSREEIIKHIATEPFMPPTIVDFRCSMLAADLALVTYRSIREDPKTGLRNYALRCSIWQKLDRSWRVRFHQGTRAL